MDSKAWWTSKSVWGGIVGIIATALTAAGVHVLDDPAAQAELVGALTGIAMVVLRFVTSKPIG